MINDDIVVVPYDPAWPGRFAELAAPIRAALGDAILSLEHVGSTSVPGLAAKPVIDILVGISPVVLSEARDAYAALKRDLAARYPTDRVAYTDSKEPLIVELLKQAHEWDAAGRN